MIESIDPSHYQEPESIQQPPIGTGKLKSICLPSSSMSSYFESNRRVSTGRRTPRGPSTGALRFSDNGSDDESMKRIDATQHPEPGSAHQVPIGTPLPPLALTLAQPAVEVIDSSRQAPIRIPLLPPGLTLDQNGIKVTPRVNTNHILGRVGTPLLPPGLTLTGQQAGILEPGSSKEDSVEAVTRGMAQLIVGQPLRTATPEYIPSPPSPPGLTLTISEAGSSVENIVERMIG